MVRVFHVFIPGRTVALALTEGLVIVFALIVATYAHFGADAPIVLTYENMLAKVVIASILAMACMHFHDLYHSAALRSLGAVFTRLLQVVGALCLIAGLAFYTVPVGAFGYRLVLVWIALAAAGLSVWRILFFFYNRSRRLQHRVLFVGESPLQPLLLKEIEARPELGLHVVGYVDPNGPGQQISTVPRLGPEADLFEIVRRERVSRVVVGHSRHVHDPVMRRRLNSGVLVEDAEDLYEAIFDKVPVVEPGFLTCGKREYRIAQSTLLYQAVTSFVMAAIGLIFALPLMLLIAVAIRLDSPGPVIFRQQRVGKNGKVFTLFKFRSMRYDGDLEGDSQPAQRNDSRVTRVGHFIRRTRMDELPQLWNIVRGDMHLVGPRPFVVDMEEKLARAIPGYTDRWIVKPGVTGWAQIRRPYCATLDDNMDKLAHDLFYIKNMSLGFDILIIFETVKILLLGRGSR